MNVMAVLAAPGTTLTGICVWAPSVVDNDDTPSQIAVTISIPVIHDFYTRLCRRGKHRRVALVVAMHKLLLILTAVV